MGGSVRGGIATASSTLMSADCVARQLKDRLTLRVPTVSALSADGVRGHSPRPIRWKFRSKQPFYWGVCNWHGPCCVMRVRTDDNHLLGDAHEHYLYQTHLFRSRSRREQPDHGCRRIFVRASIAPANDCSRFCEGSGCESMADLVAGGRAISSNSIGMRETRGSTLGVGRSRSSVRWFSPGLGKGCIQGVALGALDMVPVGDRQHPIHTAGEFGPGVRKFS